MLSASNAHQPKALLYFIVFHENIVLMHFHANSLM